jgi:hypothetical protein
MWGLQWCIQLREKRAHEARPMSQWVGAASSILGQHVRRCLCFCTRGGWWSGCLAGLLCGRWHPCHHTCQTQFRLQAGFCPAKVTRMLAEGGEEGCVIRFIHHFGFGPACV